MDPTRKNPGRDDPARGQGFAESAKIAHGNLSTPEVDSALILGAAFQLSRAIDEAVAALESVGKYSEVNRLADAVDAVRIAAGGGP
jgi:hypothetical protein